ncbi:hypothetical protein BGZ54_005957, partial [Gamsiella multidivaricata]
DTDSDTDSEAETTPIEQEWTVVTHHKERVLALRVAMDDLNGATQREKRQDLMDILYGEEISPTRPPTRMKADGKQFFRVEVATQEEMDRLLYGIAVDDSVNESLEIQEEPGTAEEEGGDNNMEDAQEEDQCSQSTGSETLRYIFEKIDELSEREHDIARSMDICGVPVRIHDDLLKLALNKLGE